MVSLRSFFRPVKDGSPTRPAVLVRVKPKPAAPVSAEAYVSPLQTELKAIIADRQRICTHHCSGCSQNVGGKCALDVREAKAVQEREDPTPYLADLQQNIKDLESATERARVVFEDAKKWQMPITRIRLGVYTAVASGVVSLGIQVARWLLGLP